MSISCPTPGRAVMPGPAAGGGRRAGAPLARGRTSIASAAPGRQGEEAAADPGQGREPADIHPLRVRNAGHRQCRARTQRRQAHAQFRPADQWDLADAKATLPPTLELIETDTEFWIGHRHLHAQRHAGGAQVTARTAASWSMFSLDGAKPKAAARRARTQARREAAAAPATAPAIEPPETVPAKDAAAPQPPPKLASLPPLIDAVAPPPAKTAARTAVKTAVRTNSSRHRSQPRHRHSDTCGPPAPASCARRDAPPNSSLPVEAAPVVRANRLQPSEAPKPTVVERTGPHPMRTRRCRRDELSGDKLPSNSRSRRRRPPPSSSAPTRCGWCSTPRPRSTSRC